MRSGSSLSRRRSAVARSPTSSRRCAKSRVRSAPRRRTAPSPMPSQPAEPRPSQSGVQAPRSRGVLARYADFLPLTAATPRFTLGEGDTPLIRAYSLEQRTGAAAVYLKLESCNPTGSFKDRGMVLAVAKAVEAGFRA